MLIGEVVRRSGVSARMLRHYESLGLVSPSGRTAAGYREYSGEDIRRIFHVESLRSLGLSLREIQRALDDPGFTPSALVDDLIDATEARVAREQELLERLRRVGSAEPSDWEDVLRIVMLLHALGSHEPALRQRAVLSPVESKAPPADLLAEAVLAEPDPNVAGALRWALARAGDEGLAGLAAGLGSAEPEIRQRAVLAVTAVEGAASTALLLDTLADPDPVVRARAALASGSRGRTEAVPLLIGMVVEGTHDVEAAEVLGKLAQDPEIAEQITEAFLGLLDAATTGSSARLRLAQGLAEIPGDAATRVLSRLRHDADRAVALTAAAILQAGA